jgi:hypothetical protein
MNRDILTWIIIGVIFLLLVYLIYYTQSEGYKCMVDATKYARDLIHSSNGEVIPFNFNITQ